MEQQAAEVVSYFHGTFWALVPSVVAIVLALITKEAYSSLFVGVGLAFSTGTSWGTFGILIPIVVAAFSSVDPNLLIISISACMMAGAVCGDHISPISDTTIMASAGTDCNHVNHLNAQLPYALSVACVSFVCYIVAGFTRSAVLSLAIGLALIVGGALLVKKNTVG